MVGPKSFGNEGRSEGSGAEGIGVPGFSTQVTPPPTNAVVHRNGTSTSPTPTFRSKVATLRPPVLDRPENAPARIPSAIELDSSEAKSIPPAPTLAREDDGEIIDLLDSIPPPPTPSATQDPPLASPPPQPAIVSGSHFYDAPTVAAQSNPGHGRRRRMVFGTIGACLFVVALVGWFLSRRHDRTSTIPIVDASKGQFGSEATATASAAPSAAVADKGAPVNNAPAPSTSAASARKPKLGAPRPSHPLKSRHK